MPKEFLIERGPEMREVPDVDSREHLSEGPESARDTAKESQGDPGGKKGY